MTTIDLVWFNAGGGHRAAALALEHTLMMHGSDWHVRRLNLTEALDPRGRFREVMGFEPEDLYNRRLARGATLGMGLELKLLQGLIRLFHPAFVERLASHWRATQPDMVVSLIPNFNRALYDGLSRARPGAPFVTVMTDMADMPPHFWVEPDRLQHVVCGTGHAQRQALAAGCAPHRVHRVSGMMLGPDFYDAAPPDRAAQRRRLGLPEHTPVGLVLFGGTGSREMKRIAARLHDLPLVLLCGRNEALADELRATPAVAPRVVVGHTAEVARWMALADYFIGKPGPGSLSEAVQQGLPVIVTRNAATMPQERWNTEWVQRHGLGLVLRDFGDVREAVQRITCDLSVWRGRVATMRNQAVFEVPQILQAILMRHPVVAAPAAAALPPLPMDTLPAAWPVPDERHAPSSA